MKIIRNSARCRKCGDEIESTYRHDFVSCSCGAIFVDGGKVYLRAGADDFANFESTAITEPPIESEDGSTEAHS